MPSSQKPHRVLKIFTLAMLNVSIMLSLRSLPVVAQLGLSSIFYFSIVGLVFLLPCALVSAELATGWPKSGGIYIWVREAFGDRLGFFSIWMQWIHNVAWYPVILSFIAATIAYVTFPELTENKLFVIGVILVSFWGMTLLNMLGIRFSSRLSSIGVIAGTILPGLFIIVLGCIWIRTNTSIDTPFRNPELTHKFGSLDSLVFLSGLFLAFSGLEVSASLAGEVQKPQKSYPKAIALAACITFILLVVGGIMISYVIPPAQMSLVSGVVEAMDQFLAAFHLEPLKPFIGVLLAVGALAEVNSWLISPVKGLHATSLHGNLPPSLQKLNDHGTPTRLLLLQGAIVTVTSFVFLFMPTTSGAFWILTILSAQSYLIMYLVMFMAAIALRYIKPKVKRVYKVPFGNVGMWLCGIFGILACLFAISLGFVPPSDLEVGSTTFYKLFLAGGLLFMCLIPFCIYHFKKPSWYLSLARAHEEKRRNDGSNSSSK